MSKFKFTVDRKGWVRGREDVSLLNYYGKCCLGFAALALGYSEEQIRNIGRPEELVDKLIDQGVQEKEANL